MDDAATSTNSVATLKPIIPLPDWLKDNDWFLIPLVVLLAVGMYYLMLQLGRQLKRRQGVQLGVLYHVFSLGFAIFLPIALLSPQ